MGCALLASVGTLVANYGKPPVPWRAGKTACLQYLATLQQTIEFPWLMTIILFWASDPSILLMILPARRCISAQIRFAKKMIATPGIRLPSSVTKEQLEHIEVADNNVVAPLFAELEIVLAFFLPARVIFGGVLGIGGASAMHGCIQAFMYWQVLWMKYHAPKTKAKQLGAWKSLQTKGEPILSKLPPPVHKGIEYLTVKYQTSPAGTPVPA